MVAPADSREIVLNVLVQMVRARRRELELSQREAASSVGMHRSHWSAIECGKKDPALETVAKVAVTLGLRPSEFLVEVHRASRGVEKAGGET
jgi:transcriptional regulator with XRE-family HTH domain